MGEHMLALAAGLRDCCRLLLACPASAAPMLLPRANALGLTTLALDALSGADRHEQLGQWLRTHHVDVFHAHAGIAWEGQQTIRVARSAGVPVVVRTEHLPQLLTGARLRRQHRATMALVDRLICVSDAARQSYVSSGLTGAKVAVIRNGIAPRVPGRSREAVRASLGVAPEDRVVLTVARMTDQKGYWHLLGAVPAILAGEPRARFLWVGTGRIEKHLRAAAQYHSLTPCIRFLGQRDDVPDLLAAADLFVLPSWFEGLPLSLLEAMAAGLPVVGTRVCGTAEVVQDGVNGHLVEPGNETALAEAILAVLHDPDEAARYGRAGPPHVEEHYSAPRMVRETLALYGSLLADARLRETAPQANGYRSSVTATGA